MKYHTYDFSCCYATYSLSGNKLTRMASTNTAFYVHNNYKDVYKDDKKEKQFFENRNIEKFKHIIFVSNEYKKEFLRLYPQLENKVMVLNNFIDTKDIIEKSKEKIKEHKPRGKKLFVFVGRLDDEAKKVGRAIVLTKEINDMMLWIVGDGPDRKMYEDLVKKNKLENKVTFLGKKKNPYPYMKKADYILMTSDYEGFPVIYLETITLQTPLITTIDVSDDKIKIGKDYAKIISKNQKKMLKQVKEILSSPKQVKKIDIENIQKERMKTFEKLFDGVI